MVHGIITLFQQQNEQCIMQYVPCLLLLLLPLLTADTNRHFDGHHWIYTYIEQMNLYYIGEIL